MGYVHVLCTFWGSWQGVETREGERERESSVRGQDNGRLEEEEEEEEEEEGRGREDSQQEAVAGHSFRQQEV